MKVPQDRLLCPTHVNNKKKQVFEIFLCVTQPDISGNQVTQPVTKNDSYMGASFQALMPDV